MPHRLRRYFALLVVGPAVLFAGLGIYTAWRSRAELVIEVQRDAASRASEQVRSYRDRVHDRLAVPLDSLRHAISGPGARYTVYDDRGAVIDNHPPDANPVQLDLGGGRGDALLLAARRGSAAVDVIWLEGSPLWLAYIPSHDTLAVVLESVDLGFVNSLISGASGLTAALYIDDGLVAAVGSDWPPALRSTLADSLLELDRALATSLRGSDAAIAPVKDFDDWDIIGAIAVRLEGRASSIPELPIAPLLALILSVALAGPTVWWTVTRGLTLRPLVAPARARHLRRGFALALLPPALAATWLASSDASLSARATDALLDLSHGIVRNEVQLGRKLHLSAASRIARLSGAEVIRLSSDSIADAASLQIPAEMLQTAEGSAGRLRSGDLVYSYRSIDLIDGSRLFLLRTPLEEARKGALFWLAGLYGALAVGFLIFASLAATSDSTLALHEARTAWAFITPSLILLLLFSAAPLLFSLYLSFHGWNLLEDAKPLVGLRHYIELAGDGLFWNAAKNTALYSLYVPLTMACAL
ncbi:MAG: sugar ABC transporter permease, partial [Gemmatimonadota bacterium]